MTGELQAKQCVPCRVGTPPLGSDQVADLLTQLDHWEVVEGHHLQKSWTFDDFKQAMAFAVAVGELAEREGHHPDIYLAWGKVRLTVWTHKIDGLTESDFVLAAKIDQIR